MTIRELRIFVRCAVAQLMNGNESLAHGPINSAVVLRTDGNRTDRVWRTVNRLMDDRPVVLIRYTNECDYWLEGV